MYKTYRNEDRGCPEIESSYSKGCRSFVGVVNFLTLFCPQLQKLLKPIYDLTSKGRVFHWGTEQQEAFYEIKRCLQKSSILYMPHNKRRFHFSSDICKFAFGSALFQIQNGQPRLIAYARQRIPRVT